MQQDYAIQDYAINVQDLNYSYGSGALKKQILYDINLRIEPGEIVIISGPSGSGKTTLLSLMAGLRTVQEGSLRILDLELNNVNKEKLLDLRRQLGYIFQSHNLVPFLSAIDNASVGLRLNKKLSARDIEARAHQLLNAVGLEGKAESLPENLSVGQKQRVAIARAWPPNLPLF
jgi:putative ABC transport system ATP-binding protein